MNPFNGSYNGNGFSISNLSIIDCSHKYIGLFGYVSEGQLSNISLTGVNISLDWSLLDWTSNWSNPACDLLLGAIAGSAEKIENCEASGMIDIVNIHDACIGGLIGTGQASNCTNRININVLANKDGRYANDSNVKVGGISGQAYYTNGAMNSCINFGDLVVSAGDWVYCGGICGEDGNFQYCINYGDVDATKTGGLSYSDSGFVNGNAGGIVGVTTSGLNYCANYGSITARTTNPDIGGYSGRYNSICAASDCYSVESTLVNGEYPTDGLLSNEKNGKPLPTSEIESLVQIILDYIQFNKL